MKIIQETADSIIFTDDFQGQQVRFVKTKATNDVYIYSEDLARVLGWESAHEMLSDDQVLDAMNLMKSKAGHNPLKTLNLETAKAITGSKEASVNAEVFCLINPGVREAEQELDFALKLLEGSNPSIVKANVLNSTTKYNSGRKGEREFVIELHCDQSGSVVLTRDCVQQILSLLTEFRPA